MLAFYLWILSYLWNCWIFQVRTVCRKLELVNKVHDFYSVSLAQIQNVVPLYYQNRYKIFVFLEFEIAEANFFFVTVHVAYSDTFFTRKFTIAKNFSAYLKSFNRSKSFFVFFVYILTVPSQPKSQCYFLTWRWTFIGLVSPLEQERWLFFFVIYYIR